MSTLFESARHTAPLALAFTATSTLDVATAVRRRLRESAYQPLRQVACDFHEGVVILRGRLPSFFLKQMAQEAVRELDGVEEIANYIEVVGEIDGPLRPQVTEPHAARASGRARTGIRRDDSCHGSVESSRPLHKEVL